MQEHLVVIRKGLNGVVDNSVYHTMDYNTARDIAKQSIDRFTSMGATIFSAKIYKVQQVGFPEQI